MNEKKVHVSRTAEGLRHFNTLILRTYWIRLFDPFHEPMPHAPYRVTLGEEKWEGKADEDAWLCIRCSAPEERCLVEWGSADPAQEPQHAGDSDPLDTDDLLGWDGDRSAILPAVLSRGAGGVASKKAHPPQKEEPAAPYLYNQETYLELTGEGEDEGTRRRLHNFGFGWCEDLDQSIRAFQRVFDRNLTGQAGDVSADLHPWHDTCEPERWPVMQPPAIRPVGDAISD